MHFCQGYLLRGRTGLEFDDTSWKSYNENNTNNMINYVQQIRINDDGSIIFPMLWNYSVAVLKNKNNYLIFFI